MTELIAPVTDLTLSPEQPVHRRHRAQVAALVEQRRVRLPRRFMRRTPGCFRRAFSRLRLATFAARGVLWLGNPLRCTLDATDDATVTDHAIFRVKGH